MVTSEIPKVASVSITVVMAFRIMFSVQEVLCSIPETGKTTLYSITQIKAPLVVYSQDKIKHNVLFQQHCQATGIRLTYQPTVMFIFHSSKDKLHLRIYVILVIAYRFQGSYKLHLHLLQ